MGRIARYPPFLVFERGNFTLDKWIRRTHTTLDTVGVCKDVSCWNPLIRVRMANSSRLSQILSALDEMHRSGVVHGKLMPSNIVWFESEEGGTWKVTGMSCPVQTGDFEQRFLLSGYAAPEVVRAVEAGSDATEVGPESDMWSLGVIAYECFTGASFTGECDSRHRDSVSQARSSPKSYAKRMVLWPPYLMAKSLKRSSRWRGTRRVICCGNCCCA